MRNWIHRLAKHQKGWLVLCVLSMIFSLQIAAQEAQLPYQNVLAFGAVSDTQQVSTQAIQAAIDSCYFQGGGTVYIPPGDFCIGTVVLKDHVTLYLAAGATLYASQNINDYRMPLEDHTRPVLIYANGAKNIAIKGSGRIHGRAKRTYEPLKETDAFIEEYTENAKAAGVEMKMYYVVKPDISLVALVKCTDVRLEDFSLIESSFWTLNITRSERVFVHGLYIFSDLEKGVNADGIDIISSKDVVISDCVVTTGDDAIVLKTWDEEPTENITVSNCILTSSSTALKLGTASYGDFRHILFNNCVVKNSNRGLSIVVRNGGTVEDVVFSNITIECSRRHFNWWGNADPIWIYLTKRRENSKVGLIKNVVFENIIAKGMGTSKIESTEGPQIENIQLRNVQFMMQPENAPDKRADHAFYAQDVNGLYLQHVSVKWAETNPEKQWGSALVLDQVQGFVLIGFQGRQGLVGGDSPVIDLRNTQDVWINDCLPDGAASTLIRVSGAASKQMLFQNIDPFQKANRLLQVSEDVVDKSSINSSK